jgi:hypothetical protein
MNTAYVYQSAQVGEFRPAVLYASGPASYSLANGDVVYNPGANEYISFPSDCTTLSGNYSVRFVPTAVGNLNVRAGAPSPTQSGWTALWMASGKQGIATIVQNAAGIGMTPATVVPIVFSGGGGSGAAGTVTVLTATTISIKITSFGQGYTSAPTATISGTGGTPATLTVTAAAASGIVADTTNLSAELIQFGALVSQL